MCVIYLSNHPSIHLSIYPSVQRGCKEFAHTLLEAEKRRDLKLARSRAEKSRRSGSSQVQRPGHQVQFRVGGREKTRVRQAGRARRTVCLTQSIHSNAALLQQDPPRHTRNNTYLATGRPNQVDA